MGGLYRMPRRGHRVLPGMTVAHTDVPRMSRGALYGAVPARKT